jgi:hypothetical protein
VRIPRRETEYVHASSTDAPLGIRREVDANLQCGEADRPAAASVLAASGANRAIAQTPASGAWARRGAVTVVSFTMTTPDGSAGELEYMHFNAEGVNECQ